MSGVHATSTCRFCSLGRGSASCRNFDRPLLETSNYTVIASIGAPVEGWVLIVPKQHQLNLASHYGQREFSELRMSLSRELEQEFRSRVRIFEHGSSHRGSAIGCGVDHAHLHLLPYGSSLVPPTSDNWRSIALREVADLAEASEYLLYSDDATDHEPRVLLRRPEATVSQYFRRIVFEREGRSDQYDYRAHQFLETVERTQSRLLRRPLFSLPMAI